MNAHTQKFHVMIDIQKNKEGEVNLQCSEICKKVLYLGQVNWCVHTFYIALFFHFQSTGLFLEFLYYFCNHQDYPLFLCRQRKNGTEYLHQIAHYLEKEQASTYGIEDQFLEFFG